ncbi:MAG: Excinuclease ABC C subunit domain protein [Candidatus Magasanikbacteria bacterium GW2011_GWA2_42_32]|uniref:Excinuclease ABC C subunit domain protein n=2 Tax=Patescibacteria group TaxID=1783273 RepID=A0A0G1A5W6_9BACT|nr:MAG: Excinuclease ABC C subunit domain protein [Candidatus Magasanikbacteria bacterium GW2011_GWA2_42_32]OGY13468.1 MAG: hypothetical protein A3A77_00035 [Candidatus Blackburnbacteria bacterium RIFCSPLOWO2_01_FULL_40_20]HBL52404.1 hypothetical protein [Candidatus Blackburnbacteria bacterium]
MFGWVYILKNENTGRYYIGSTVNLVRRLKQHENGSTRTTKVLNTKTLFYQEKFDNIIDARLREKILKSYKSKKYIEWLIGKNTENQGR